MAAAETKTKGKAEFDFAAFRASEIKETPNSFADWYIENAGAEFNGAQDKAFREGVKAVYTLYTTFMSSPERKAQVAANKEAKAKAAAAKAAEPKAAKPAKAAAAKATAKPKAKPAGATDLI